MKINVDAIENLGIVKTSRRRRGGATRERDDSMGKTQAELALITYRSTRVIPSADAIVNQDWDAEITSCEFADGSVLVVCADGCASATSGAAS